MESDYLHAIRWSRAQTLHRHADKLGHYAQKEGNTERLSNMVPEGDTAVLSYQHVFP